ncbi:hypothetical protein THAOC_10427, partial [Thalassiosira oceanica]
SSAGIPHLTTGIAYLFISRSDFSGFVFDDKEETNQMYAPMNDQVMGHFKIADLGSSESGHLLLSDASSASTSKGNVLRKKKSKGMTLDELNRHQEENRRKLNELALIDPNGRQPTVSDGNIGKVDSTNGVCVKTPMDGLFPISFHRDENNEIDLITIQMMENEKVISNVLAYGETNKGLRGAVSCVIPWEVNKKRDHEGWIHPMRRELEQKRSSGFGTNGPRHLVQAVFGGPVNFVYTHGVSSTGKEGWPRVEFLYYNCLEEHLNDVVNHYNWLAMRHRTGHAVRDTSGIQVGPADIWIARKLPTEQMNKLVLSTYTTACDDDVTVLLVMPISAFSMDMMTDILMAPRIYENMKEMNAGSHPMKPSHNAHNALDFCQYCGVRRGKKILKCSRCGNTTGGQVRHASWVPAFNRGYQAESLCPPFIKAVANAENYLSLPEAQRRKIKITEAKPQPNNRARPGNDARGPTDHRVHRRAPNLGNLLSYRKIDDRGLKVSSFILDQGQLDSMFGHSVKINSAFGEKALVLSSTSLRQSKRQRTPGQSNLEPVLASHALDSNSTIKTIKRGQCPGGGIRVHHVIVRTPQSVSTKSVRGHHEQRLCCEDKGRGALLELGLAPYTHGVLPVPGRQYLYDKPTGINRFPA